MDGLFYVANRYSRIFRRQKGLLGLDEYLKILASAENSASLKEKLKRFYSMGKSENPDLQYALEQAEILKKVENIELENVASKIRQEEKKTSSLLDTLKRQEQKRPVDEKMNKINRQPNMYCYQKKKIIANFIIIYSLCV